MESASHVGNISKPVEIAKYSEPIDQDDVAVLSAGSIDSRDPQGVRSSPALDRAQVRVARFVWSDDEPRVGNLVGNRDPGGEQVFLVGRPSGARDESGTRRPQPLNERNSTALCARPHLVE